ncbi:nucleoporin NUP42 [Narcine bancroftii]|uniref:nucleoporin NUP42 n=1 Tax=Narcine bancroftii TaxID=1343680 RepID=UPI0038312D22
MPVCKFFLEGRCRFGNNCWNEHPRGGQQSGGYNSRGSWGNQFQKHSSRYIQPSTFSKPTTWASTGRDTERRGFGYSDTGKKTVANSGSFIQNRFTVLSHDSQEHDVDNLLEILRKDIEVWESSGQWLFSCYSVAKEYACVSGLVDISPEELRLEYYNSRAGGILQHYVDSIRQLSSQHKNRMLELKKPNSSAGVSVSTEFRKPNQQKLSECFGNVPSSTFNSSGFATSTLSINTFSFKPSAALGNATAAPAFGSSTSSALSQSGFGTKPGPASVFGSRPTFGTPATISSFSVFGSSAATSTPSLAVSGNSAPFGSNTTASGGFGSFAPTSSTFGSTVKASAKAFGSTVAAATTTTNVFGAIPVSIPQPHNIAASNNLVSGCDALYTPQAQLSADDLREFEAKKFTLGRIPLRPPPIELLSG